MWRCTSMLKVCPARGPDAVLAPQRGGRGGVPARGPAQLPRDVQPCWLGGGLPHAQRLHEPARTEPPRTVPGHACHRWGPRRPPGHWNGWNSFIKVNMWSLCWAIYNVTCLFSKALCLPFCFCFLDPNMVNAYMYQPAGTNGQPGPPGQAPPTTSPPYSSYQPTPTQGYQVWPTIQKGKTTSYKLTRAMNDMRQPVTLSWFSSCAERCHPAPECAPHAPVGPC